MENNVLDTIEKLLAEWQAQKENKKTSNNFFKLDNKITFINNLNNKVMNLIIKSNNKIGIQKIYDTDIYKIYLKKYYESNGVFFNTDESGKVYYMLKDGEKDRFLACLDFKKYAYDTIEKNKQKEREKREKLEKKKTGIKLSGLDSESLMAIIYQAKKQLADSKKG